jgi:tight adherence protein B
MNGPMVGALLLSLALLAFPASPRHRVAPCAPPRRRVRVGTRGAGFVTVCAAIAAAAVLPLTAVLSVAVVGSTAGLR